MRLILQVGLLWDRLPRQPPAISASCLVYDVTPIPPDPVKDATITFQQVVLERDHHGIDRTIITLRYTWSAPTFKGEGITGYQAWLSMEPAPVISMSNLREIGRNATRDELVRVFEESDTNFTLYFQVRIVIILLFCA